MEAIVEESPIPIPPSLQFCICGEQATLVDNASTQRKVWM